MDDRVTSSCQAAPRGLKQKASAVMSPSLESAFCAFMVPAPRGLWVVSVEGEKKKKNPSSLGLQADVFGIYRIDRNACQVLSTKTQTGDLNHMSSIQIWEEIWE